MSTGRHCGIQAHDFGEYIHYRQALASTGRYWEVLAGGGGVVGKWG